MMLDTGRSYAKPDGAHGKLQDDLIRYFAQKSPPWIAVRELDLGSRSLDKEVKRADVFAMSETYPPRSIICEVKVSRPDFFRGVKEETYLHYMENCNLFYFVTPYRLITYDIPFGCGWLEQWENGKGFDEYGGEPNNQFKMNDQLWHNLVKKLG